MEESDRLMHPAFSEPGHSGPGSGSVSQRTAAVSLFALTSVFLVSVLYYPPDGTYLTICLFKSLTGLPCPGCGLTHSFCALAKGHIAQALSYNLLGPPIFVLASAFWLRSIGVLLGRTRAVNAFDRFGRSPGLARLLLIALVVYGVARMIYIIVFAPHLIQSAPLLKLIGLFARL
jgi:hypothetical protein